MPELPTVIFPEGFDERAEFETPHKGWLSAHVEMNDGTRYAIYLSDPVRLQQDLAENAQLGRPYLAEPGLILLPEVTAEAIRETVQSLCEQDFFGHLRPCQDNER